MSAWLINCLSVFSHIWLMFNLFVQNSRHLSGGAYTYIKIRISKHKQTPGLLTNQRTYMYDSQLIAVELKRWL